MRHAAIDGRVQQGLITQLRRSPIAGDETHHRGEIAAGAVAADGEALAVDAEGYGLPRDPRSRREAILDRCRKFVFRSEAVIDRDDDASRPIGKMAAEAVMGVEIADDPAAAMEVDEGGKGAAGRCRRAAIEAQRDRRAAWSRRREFAKF